MSTPLEYKVEPAFSQIPAADWENLKPQLDAARQETLADVDLLTSGEKVPADKQPLDAGFIMLPTNLLEEQKSQGEQSLLGQIKAVAKGLQPMIDRFLVLGIGGSYMGMRALFEGLCHPYHNELSRSARGGIPRLYFAGNNIDNDETAGLLEVLQASSNNSPIENRWGMTVISKSGGTLETAVAFRLFRDALEKTYGAESKEVTELVVPITGESGKLRDLANATGYPAIFPIPDGVGGRFSVFTAVGLFPAAVMGVDIDALLQGAADMTERFRTAPIGENPVLDYTGVCHLLEKNKGLSTRILSTWGSRLEAFGLWYDQLLAESIGKEEKGALPLTVVNTRDLHSRGQQHQEGVRDKLITNVIVEEPSTAPVSVPQVGEDRDQDQLNRLQGKAMPELMDAAIKGTNKAYAEVNRPTADLVFPKLDAYALGQALQMMMLATVVEGRLIGINPYGQPGVEAYKQNMGEILYGK
ncbi:Glucose-6-phosphate isomerase [Polystyrenella longa]|uniref:Glucose-6-phosphate isomerase n=1 Tax=Polystyrenella longa TaxID=2528007 RepID=A0A518CGW9_9PLAN|nr:glucose-6-phosphate isomerase [Polystyrenella longa]QDU78470.1 Glucose-6-phosphate isomerase [Polystyrenella longa]